MGKSKYIDIKGSAVPGYQGYIPGKVADNVYGQPEARTNRIAQDRRQIPAYAPELHGGLEAEHCPQRHHSAFYGEGAPRVQSRKVAGDHGVQVWFGTGDSPRAVHVEQA